MHWCIAALVLAQAGPTPLTRANTCYQGLWCGATVCSVTRPERPKGAKDEDKVARRATN